MYTFSALNKELQGLGLDNTAEKSLVTYACEVGSPHICIELRRVENMLILSSK